MSNANSEHNAGSRYIRTYGRIKGFRKVDAWLSPDYRRKAFSSTDVSEPSIVEANDSSVQLKKRKKKGSGKTTRAAKKKAMSELKERDSDEENVFLPDFEVKTTATRIRNPSQVRMRKGTKESSGQSENEQPVAVARKRQKKSTCIFITSKSDEDSVMKNSAVTSVLVKKNSKTKRSESENSANPGKRGKFVTARRKVRSVKQKGPRSKPPVLRPSLTLNSSDDFARAGPVLSRAVTRRKRPPPCLPASLEWSSSDVSCGPLRGGRAQALVREEAASASLNASGDCPSLSCHVPLFSSTPSVLLKRQPPQLQDPSLSGIHFSLEDSASSAKLPQPNEPGLPVHPATPPRRRLRTTTARQPCLKVSPEAAGGINDSSNNDVTKQHHRASLSRANRPPAPVATNIWVEENTSQSVVLVEVTNRVEPPSPMEEPPSPLQEPLSRAGGTGQTGEPRPEEHQLSLELFSQVESGGEDNTKGGGTASRTGSGFVTAKTRLASLAEALKERCRSTSPVVMLPRAYLSPTLDTSSRMLGAGETFSSCLDSQPTADDESTWRRGGDRTGAAFALSPCPSETPSPRSTVSPAPPPAVPSPGRAALMEDSGEEGGGGAVRGGGRSSGTAQEAAGVEAQVERLKARCLSSQPVVLLDSLRLSPFLRRVTSSAPASGAAGTPGRTEPASTSTSPSTSTSSSNGSGSAACTDAEPGDEPCARPKRHPRRRLTNSFLKAGAGQASSPERTLLAGRSKQLAGRVGTGRKACVSGLSANRWTKRDSALGRSRHAHDSLDFGRPAAAKHGKEPMSSLVLPITPARVEQLNISSILTSFSPNASTTHMWSRLKAALSVHKKKTAYVTPRRLALSSMHSPAAQRLDASQDIFASLSQTPFSHLIQSSLGSSLLCVEDNISDAEKVYQECHQEGPLTFHQCIPPSRMKLCRKIGEGTFGEVFSTSNADGQLVALKIIPVEGKQKVNGEDQKSFGEILHEIIISKELSCLDEKENNRTHGFIGLNDLHCVQGSYPEKLLSAWDQFDQQRGSENDRPDFFDEEQYFLILEFEFGGTDLENINGKLSSLAQAKSILQQVTAALAVAEQALCFEHRDLHWGNILVKTTEQKECGYVLNGDSRSIETRGVLVNIIDYSLSRLEIDGLTVSCDISADEELFMGQGDYQFDIYRKMREENQNDWSEYHPHTNVLWLHYLTDKLLGMKYKSRAQGAQTRALKSSLLAFHRDLLAFQSATDALQHSSLFH